jgi:hypothetical protein
MLLVGLFEQPEGLVLVTEARINLLDRIPMIFPLPGAPKNLTDAFSIA